MFLVAYNVLSGWKLNAQTQEDLTYELIHNRKPPDPLNFPIIATLRKETGLMLEELTRSQNYENFTSLMETGNWLIETKYSRSSGQGHSESEKNLKRQFFGKFSHIGQKTLTDKFKVLRTYVEGWNLGPSDQSENRRVSRKLVSYKLAIKSLTPGDITSRIAALDMNREHFNTGLFSSARVDWTIEPVFDSDEGQIEVPANRPSEKPLFEKPELAFNVQLHPVVSESTTSSSPSPSPSRSHGAELRITQKQKYYRLTAKSKGSDSVIHEFRLPFGKNYIRQDVDGNFHPAATVIKLRDNYTDFSYILYRDIVKSSHGIKISYFLDQTSILFGYEFAHTPEQFHKNSTIQLSYLQIF